MLLPVRLIRYDVLDDREFRNDDGPHQVCNGPKLPIGQKLTEKINKNDVKFHLESMIRKVDGVAPIIEP